MCNNAYYYFIIKKTIMKKGTMKFNKTFSQGLVAVLTVALMLVYITTNVSAAGLINVSDTMDRQKISTAADHTIEFTLDAGTTIIQNETITVTFASGDSAGEFFDSATENVEFADMDLEFSISAAATLAAVPSPTDWGVTVVDGAASTDLVVTFTAPSTPASYVGPSETVTIQIGTVATGGVNQIINPDLTSADATGGNLGATTASRYGVVIAGTFGDTGNYIIPILDDDQVHVTASVQSELTFQLHDAADDSGSSFFDDHANIVDFGTLSSTAARFAVEGAGSGGSAATVAGGAHGFRVGTNAAAGYSTTINGPTLTSGGGDTITAIGGTAAASAPGTEQFGLCLGLDTTGTPGTTATDTAQNGAIDANYNCGAGYAFTAGADDEIATGNAAGPTSMTFYDVQYLANISALTESGEYETDITYITTGTF